MLEYLLVVVVGAGTTYLLAAVARELALRVGAVAKVRDRDVHAIPIPYFGGVAMMGGLIAAYIVARHLPYLGRSDDQVFADARAVLIGGLVICAVGVVDDLYELDAITKLAGEVLAAGVVVVQGMQLYWLPLPGGATSTTFVLDGSQAALLTVLVIVTTVNAVNFIDGLDGLAAGVIGIGAAAFFSFAYLLSVENHITVTTTPALLTAALCGVCFGFLPHNFFPARMFMGDSGALLIGFMLSASAITLTGQFDPGTISEGMAGTTASLLPTFLPLVLPIAVLVLPFVDLLLAVARRMRAGLSPFAPDRQHLHHRLLDIGHSHRRAVLVMYLWAALVSGGVVVIGLFAGWRSIVAVSTVLIFALLATFRLPSRVRDLVR
jgi:UDP-GlcNAc:undecaprenyl-phosphate GlcNAc-1-phosphate transferase